MSLRGAALAIGLAAALSGGCEVIAGIHERELAPSEASSSSGSGGGGGGSACPEGLGDCDGKSENGCETDLTSTSEHCGACGHSCLGDACFDSICKPTVMATDKSAPFTLAVTSTGIYWTSASGNVNKLPLEGGNVQEIAPVQPGQVKSTGIAVTATTIFWTVNDASTNGTVMRAGLDGFGVSPLFSNQKLPAGVAADDTTVYWAAAYADKVLSGSPSGGAPNDLATLPAFSTPYAIVVDKKNAYFTTIDGNTVEMIPIGGGAVKTLAVNQKTPFAIAASDTALYWTNLDKPGYKAGEVRMTPKDGSGQKPAILAADQYAPNAIAVDPAGSAVYWTTLGHNPESGGGATGSVMKLALAAGGAQDPSASPVVLATGQSSPTGIAFYEGVLYWCNGATGEILRMVQ